MRNGGADGAEFTYLEQQMNGGEATQWKGPPLV